MEKIGISDKVKHLAVLNYLMKITNIIQKDKWYIKEQ